MMLAIFEEAVAHPPAELRSPAADDGGKKPKLLPEETLRKFLTSNPRSSFAVKPANTAFLAYSTATPPHSFTPRLFCGYDDMYCIFIGSLNNLCGQMKQYGLAKNANEAMVVIEAYRTLRDRGPYPVDQVIRDFDGTFAFVLYDAKSPSIFLALGSDGALELYWGVGEDGSVVISDDKQVVKGACGSSYAPFPPGCVFHSEGGLMSFEHPMNKMRAMPRVDSEGLMRGADFKVDMYARMNSIPRVGSEANWADWPTANSL